MIELSQLKVWWEGPTFLSDDKSNWPQLETVDKPDSYARELKRKHNNIPLSSNATLINVEESVAESRPVRRIFKRGVLIAATGDLQRGDQGAQPSDADESSISCYLRVA